MNMPNFTEDEKLIINSGLSMVGGAVVGVAQAEYQYLTTPGGHVTLGGAISFALATFGVLLGVALRAYVPAHAQQMINDAQARATQLEEALHLASSAQPVIATSIQQTPVAASQPSQSPVTIHINGTPAQTMPTVTMSGTPATTLASVTQSVNSASSLVDVGPIAATPDISNEDTAVRAAVQK